MISTVNTWIIFRCVKDDCWVVSKKTREDIFLGVAECPDEVTARAVMEALVLRDKVKNPNA